MASQTDIVNLALQKLSDVSVISIGDDGRAARAISLCYNMVRRAELRKHPWNFAIRRTTLSALAQAPAWGFDKQMVLPADFVRLVEVRDVEHFKLENSGNQRVILANEAPLNISYVSDVTNEGLFDALFAVVLASALAMQVARSLTDSESLFNRVVAVYQDDWNRATNVDGQEDPSVEPDEGSWNRARY